MKTSYVFWPSFFVFLICFFHDFYAYQAKFLELDFQLKKPQSILNGIFSFPQDMPPLVIPKSEKSESGPKMLDPKAGDSA